MTPRWLVVEKLVMELGGVCASYEAGREAAVKSRAGAAAVAEATEAVTAVLQGAEDDRDAIVRTAWAAIARAQDVIRDLQETMDRSRDLREAAVKLQDRSLLLRRPREDRS